MSVKHSYRLFVAIPVPDEVKSTLVRVQSELCEIIPRRSASWTRPDNMHLTLRFLGDVEADQAAELQSSLLDRVAGFGAIDLICERLGCFPDLRFPRVVWAWVHDAEDRLSSLCQRVNEAAAPFAGKPADARFTGHITLMRPRQLRLPGSTRLASFVEGAVTRQFGRWSASSVELIRSELSPSGSRYTTLAALPFS